MPVREVTLASGDSTQITTVLDQNDSVLEITVNPGDSRGSGSADPPFSEYQLQVEKTVDGSFTEITGSPITESSLDKQTFATTDTGEDDIRITITNTGSNTGTGIININSLGGDEALKTLENGRQFNKTSQDTTVKGATNYETPDGTQYPIQISNGVLSVDPSAILHSIQDNIAVYNQRPTSAGFAESGSGDTSEIVDVNEDGNSAGQMYLRVGDTVDDSVTANITYSPNRPSPPSWNDDIAMAYSMGQAVATGNLNTNEGKYIFGFDDPETSGMGFVLDPQNQSAAQAGLNGTLTNLTDSQGNNVNFSDIEVYGPWYMRWHPGEKAEFSFYDRNTAQGGTQYTATISSNLPSGDFLGYAFCHVEVRVAAGSPNAGDFITLPIESIKFVALSNYNNDHSI